jgi:hypothetical protein
MRIMLRLAILALAGYGAWRLYDEYGKQLPGMRPRFDEFSARTKRATGRAADRVSVDAEDARGAIRDAAVDVRDAAADAGASAQRNLREPRATSPRS